MENIVLKKPLLSALLFALIIIITALAPTRHADAQESVDERIERLEQEVRTMRERMEDVEVDGEEAKHSYGLLTRLVDVSGYADVEYRHTGQDGVNDGFRVRHLSLFFTKEIQENWKLFTEIEFEDAPYVESAHTTDTVGTAQGKLLVEQMYIEYTHALNLDVRFGRYLVPAGIWNIYHYYPYVPTQERPLMIRNVFPQAADGLVLNGSAPLFGSMLDAHLYVSNGAGNPGRMDRNEQKAVGARLNYSTSLLSGISFGTSYYRERDNSDALRNSYGIHLQADIHGFELQSEYAYRTNSPSGAQDYNDKGLYAQLTYDIGRFTLAGRYDWYDTDDTDPKNDSFRYTGALNYHIAHNIVAKAEYNRNLFDDPASDDYDEVIFALVVAIGDL